MNFTDIFIKRPVFATVLSLIILLVGIKSFFALSVRLWPKIDTAVVSVQVKYPGADAALMESFVTTPIENALGGVDGIDYISSQSKNGESDIAVHFVLGYDINVAVTDISSKISSVRWKLPKEVYDPVVDKKDPNARATMYITYSSDTVSKEEITDYIERIVQPQLQTLPGIASSQILNPAEYAMRIWLDPQLMAAHQVTPIDVVNGVMLGNLQSASGQIRSTYQLFNVKTLSELVKPEQFSDIVLRNQNGQVVKISDVGRAELGDRYTDYSVLADGKEAIIIAITPNSVANPLDISKEVKALLPKLDKTIPPGVHAKLLWDSSIFIEHSIQEIEKTILISALFVIAIVFLFLGSFRVLLIPTVTIPLSLIGVCGVMLMLGYSLNTLTFLAMVLAIGMVVDDAIVVSENIHRHLLTGKSPIEAAMLGAREIQFAVIALTLTLAAVYAPIAFLKGLIGELFKEFSVTLASAVIISGFVALTLSPMMCSKVMRSDVLSHGFAEKVHRWSEQGMNIYRVILTKVLNKRILILFILPLILIACVMMYTMLPSELAPNEDQGFIFTFASPPTAASYDYTQKYLRQIASIYEKVPEKQNYMAINAPGFYGAPLILKPWDQRKRSVDQIIQSLIPPVMMIPGIRAFPLNLPSLPGVDSLTPVSIAIQSTGDYNELYQIGQKMLKALAANPRLVNLDTDLKIDEPQLNVKIDYSKAYDLGIPADDIAKTINFALGEPATGHFSILGRSYDVVPQLEKEFRNSPDALKNLQLRTSSGELVPLSNFAEIQESVEPASLNHFQQLRSLSITASIMPGYTIGQALDYVNNVTAQIVPSQMKIDYGGASRQFMQTKGQMLATFGFAIIFIFLVLAAQFESFMDPLVVMFTIPLSTFGALLALVLTGKTMNIYSEIGIITLIGLISKHGILMVEFANQLRRKGSELKQAIIEAAAVRLRPVLMTTAAMALGAVPLVIATGAGAVSRRQIGVVIVGGMVIGTIFTLFVIPVVYTYLASRRKVES
jgi:multidrug efflux pump